MKLTHKAPIFLLLLSIPCNFILFEGIGNVYISTLLIPLVFLFYLFITNGKLITIPSSFLSILIFLFILLSTLFSIMLNENLNSNIVGSVIYFQSILVFMIFSYLVGVDAFYKYFFKLFIIICFFVALRVVVEEYNNLFLLSTRWGERIEAHFVGAVNNFALFCGLGFFCSSFMVRKGITRILLVLFFFVMMVLTLSRGAILGVAITVFAVAIYNPDKKLFFSLIRIVFFLCFLGIFSTFFLDSSGEIVGKVLDRFLGFFSGEVNLTAFSSGRILVWEDLLTRYFGSSLFEILFGHGTGSFNFIIGELDYESSHNIFLDVLYKNGILILFLYILVLLHILFLFLKNRNKHNLLLFSLFFFLHFEILFNPFPFAAQTGWVYFAFLAIFLKQDKLHKNA